MPDREEKLRNKKFRIRAKIHDFCFGEDMADKGCVNCPINHIDACGENPPMEKLREAERFIDEVMQNDQL